MNPLRPLLPAMEGQRNVPQQRPKKRLTPLACESCRQFKSKCDGQPNCSACIKRATTCSYSQPESRQIRKKYERLQQRESTYEDLIDLIRTMTEEDAAEVFRRLKAGMDVESIVKHVRDGSLLMQLSLMPETTRQFEFPYKASMPRHLLVAGNMYMESRLYSAVSSSPAYTNAQNRQLTTRYGTAYMLPYNTAKLVEPLIDSLTTAPWTRVISDNRLLRRLISLYFTHPHPCTTPLVLQDLFLEDMAAGRTTFCSPLLMNAILAIASQMCVDIPDRVKVWHPDSLTYKFLAEARRLWDLEPTEEPHITTIQAALALSQTYIINSLDGLSTFFLEQAIKMGQHMHLFDISNTEDARMAKARLHTAWKTFSWQSMLAYAYFRAPHMKDPPQIPLPDMEIDSQCEILSLKRKFETWKAALPETLQPGALVLPHSFSLHFRYHQAMIGLIQSLLPDSSDTVTDSGLSAEDTPRATMKSLETSLEFLMRLYYMRHSFDIYGPWLIYPMAKLGNQANKLLECGSEEDTGNLDGYRSTIILCAQAIESQARYFHVAASLGVQLQSIVKPQMLQLMRAHVKAIDADKTDEEMIAKHPLSQWPIPIIDLRDDPEKARLKHLIEAFKETRIQPGAVKD
ncbi:hypothetical protein OPT61_g4193 [Boeremia exigua]|uniref:Uncharacterized protein n=1 Tax=Boeremia exigua TaxID=749465 RepID=A0ACC2IEY8_9PLEO|nr:hypothetical protein OPT61_g4193 [Boeremia exigua]